MTLGGTTRFYDKAGDERFNLSAGQIYYLNDSRIDDNPANKTPTSSSSWALESNWKMSDHWPVGVAVINMIRIRTQHR